MRKGISRERTIALFIGSLETGGAEKQLSELLRYIDRSRYKTLLILLRSNSSPVSSNLADKTIAILPPKASDPTNGENTITKYLTVVWRLSKILRANKPAIFHSFLGDRGLLIGVPAARLARVPKLIVGRRGSAKVLRSTFLHAVAERIAMRFTDLMVANCNMLASELATLDRYPRTRIRVIHNGVDSKRFHPGRCRELRTTFGFSDENIVIGMVANFHVYKRHIDFVNAARKIADNAPKARFLLAGEERGTLVNTRKQIEELGLTPLFHITSSTCPETSIYPALDICVSTSGTEGLSNVLLEASACGLPIVATDVGGNSECVTDEVSGFMVKAFSPEEVAERVIRLVKDEDLRSRLGIAGRKRVLADFSLEKFVSQYEATYDDLIGNAV